MSLQVKIEDVLTRIGTEFKTVYVKVGNLSSLTTTEKTSLVLALNELKALINTAAIINDITPSGSSVFSSTKVNTLIATAKSEIIGGADSLHDTLIEIQGLLNADGSNITTLLTAVDNRVRFDAAQSLTAPQKAQAIANVGAVSASDVGNVSTDFVVVFNAALL